MLPSVIPPTNLHDVSDSSQESPHLEPIDASKKEEPEELSFLGRHTLVPSLLESSVADIVCHGNKKLPPYVIATGHAERVRDCAALLDANSSVICSDVMKSFGHDKGRVEVVVGTYKGTPVVVTEHQMGGSAAEILLREVLAPEIMTADYTVNNVRFQSNAKYLIRIGTSLGINTDFDAKTGAQQQPILAGGDIIISSHQVGISGADIQAITSCINPIAAARKFDKMKSKFTEMGYQLRTDAEGNEWPYLEMDPSFVDTLVKVSKKVIAKSTVPKTAVHAMGNHSKDSLYAENFPSEFINLRNEFNVGTSEMELSALSRLAAQMTREAGLKKAKAAKDYNPDCDTPVKCGCILLPVGIMPGLSFLDPKKVDLKSAAKLQWIIALETLHLISQSHITQ